MLCVAAVSVTVEAQTGSISGVVTDDSGAPLMGVRVRATDGSMGGFGFGNVDFTDMDGAYPCILLLFTVSHLVTSPLRTCMLASRTFSVSELHRYLSTFKLAHHCHTYRLCLLLSMVCIWVSYWSALRARIVSPSLTMSR